jgi:hypothetical protein
MTTLHRDILLLLRPCAPYGLSVKKMLGDLRAEGHRDLTEPALETAIRDLADKALVDLLDSVLGPRWRVTELGKSTLREAGL